SYGPDHPTVAIRCNNLAGLLRATNRLAEAEPLHRRACAIRLLFTAETGHEHPNLRTAVGNYAICLLELGNSEAEVAAHLQKMCDEFGVKLDL
ncbi:MAG: tetratricopeptide repeat protein, partial [Candidatus Hydrogenedentales bacterium]